MTVVSGRVHKDNLDRFLPLIVEAIREPAFQQDDLDRIKSQTLNYLENTLRYSSDEELGKAVFYNTAFFGPTDGPTDAPGLDDGLERSPHSDRQWAEIQKQLQSPWPIVPRYGHLPQGTVAGVRSLTLDDVRRFYRDHYVQPNVVLGLGGGYDDATAVNCAKSWPRCPPATARKSRSCAA